MVYEQYINGIIERLGLNDLPAEEQKNIRLQIEESMEKRLLADLISKLSPEQIKNMGELIEFDKNQEEDVLAYLMKEVPNSMDVVTNSLLNFQNELLKKTESSN